MKKLILFALSTLLTISLYAQQDIVIKASKKTTIAATPRQIIDSLKKRFPNAKAIQSYKTPASGIKSGWNITEEDNTGFGDDIDAYTLSFKRDDFKYYALYKADGTLLKAKYEQYGATLPDPAKEALTKLAGKEYNNYTVQSRTYYRTVDYGKNKSYYQVLAVNKKNPKIKKMITVDGAGKVIKVK